MDEIWHDEQLDVSNQFVNDKLSYLTNVLNDKQLHNVVINTTHHIGIATIGTPLRHPSYDLRGTPPLPRRFTSPWLESTLDIDMNIRDDKN